VMVTLICAASVRAAEGWCRRNGVQPRATGTAILTPRSPSAGRGRALTSEDRVVYVGDFDARVIEAALIPAGLDRSRIEYAP
jgi:hypothetical protein